MTSTAHATAMPAPAALVCVIALLAAGCTFTQRPQARVDDVFVASQDRAGGVVAFELRVSHENDFAMTLPEAGYRLSVDGAEPFVLESTVPLASLPPGGEQVLTFTAAFPADEPLSGRAYRLRGQLWYDDPSDLRQVLEETGFPRPSVAFEHEGVLP